MERYPATLTTQQYLESDCYKVATFAFAQTHAMGSLSAKHSIAPTLWELTEEAKMLGCLPVVTFVPRDAALAIMEPVLDAADVRNNQTISYSAAL